MPETTAHVRTVQKNVRTRTYSGSPHAPDSAVPTTMCGANPTTVDWDARTAASKTHAAAAAEQHVCAACLTAARSRAANQADRSPAPDVPRERVRHR